MNGPTANLLHASHWISRAMLRAVSRRGVGNESCLPALSEGVAFKQKFTAMRRPTLAASATLISLLSGAAVAQQPVPTGFDVASLYLRLQELGCSLGDGAVVGMVNDLLTVDDVSCKSGHYDIQLTRTLALVSMVRTAANAEFAAPDPVGDLERLRIDLSLARFNCRLGNTPFYLDGGDFVIPGILCSAGLYDARLDADFNVLSLTSGAPARPPATTAVPPATTAVPLDPLPGPPPAPSPTAQPAAPSFATPTQPPADFVGFDVRAAGNLELRIGPDLTDAVLAVIPVGSIVVVNACLEGFAWCDVTAGSARGWTSGAYLISVTMEQPVTVVGERLGIPTTTARGDVTPPLVAQICFYPDANFAGVAFCSPPGEIAPTPPPDWDRGISSIRVPAGMALEVCTQPDFGGACRTFTDDVPQLPPIFDDGVLSFRPPQPATTTQANQPAAGQVCFYSGPNFGGEQLCVRVDLPLARMSPEWNDRISSLRVGANAVVEVCTDEGFAGTCRSLEDDVTQLPAVLNNAISSYRRAQPGAAIERGGAAPNQVCFYGDINFAGAVLCTTVTQAVPVIMTELRDSISSIRVGVGTSVQVCTDTNFGGTCEIFEADVAQLPESLNDAVRSYRRPQGDPAPR